MTGAVAKIVADIQRGKRAGVYLLVRWLSGSAPAA